MAGQPGVPGILQFDVTNLESVETGPPLAFSENIVDVNESFGLRVTFNGSGAIWNFLQAIGAEYNAQFFSEGIGSAAPEIDFGTSTGTIASADQGGGVYQATRQVVIPSSGIYKCAVSVTFQATNPVTGVKVPVGGLLGFTDNLLLQVNALEQPGVLNP